MAWCIREKTRPPFEHFRSDMALIEAIVGFGEEQELEEQDAVLTEGENTVRSPVVLV